MPFRRSGNLASDLNIHLDGVYVPAGREMGLLSDIRRRMGPDMPELGPGGRKLNQRSKFIIITFHMMSQYNFRILIRLYLVPVLEPRDRKITEKNYICQPLGTLGVAYILRESEVFLAA